MIFPLVGNNKIKISLQTAIKENKIPHAIIIEGFKNSGRHTLADFISRAVVCGKNDGPCNDCKNCKLSKIHSHPDISVIEPEEKKKNISVDQIRNLRTEAYIKPHMANSRVFIIDKADTMSEQAENALLKILEEPPGPVVFILITESKLHMLETVISRCVVYTTGQPLYNEALQYLKNNTKYKENDISEALKNSGNSIGNALLSLKKKSFSDIYTDADMFFNNLINQNSSQMLVIALKYEKNRLQAAEFIQQIKIITEEYIKKNYKNTSICKSLKEFYNILYSYQKSLDTNINLSLLFAAMVCKSCQLIKTQ